MNDRCVGFQQISPAASTALTVPAGARYAYLSATVANVSIRSDGTAPTAAIGLMIISGQQPVKYEGDLSQVRAIAVSAGALLNVEYH